MALPRAGGLSASANEIYLLDAIGDAIPTPGAGTTQYGLFPGHPIPASGNSGDANLALSGIMRQTLSSDPTIYVKAMDMQAAIGYTEKGRFRTGHFGHHSSSRPRPQGRGNLRTPVLERPSIVFSRSRTVTALVGSSIPRFAVKRVGYNGHSDSDYVGAQIAFTSYTDLTALTAGTNDVSIAPRDDSGDPFSGTWVSYDNAALIEMADGSVMVGMLAYTSAGLYGLEFKVWHPGKHADWQHWKGYGNTGVGANSLRSLFPTTAAKTASDTANFNIHCITAFRRRGDSDVYWVASGQSGNTTALASFWVFKVNGTVDTAIADRSLSLVGETVGWGPDLTTGDCVTACATPTEYIVAQSLQSQEIGAGQVVSGSVQAKSTIQIARSADLRNWGDKTSYTSSISAATVVSHPELGKLTDSNSGFPVCKPGDTITIRGLSAAYDKTWTIAGTENSGAAMPTASVIYVITPSTWTNASESNVTVTITTPAIESLSNIIKVSPPIADDEDVTAMHFSSSGGTGWAVTDKGRAYKADYYGSSWKEVQTGVSAKNTKTGEAIAIRSVITVSGTVAIATGDSGLAMLYDSTANKWLVTGTSLYDSIDDAYKHSSFQEISSEWNLSNNGVATLDGTSHALIVGDRGTIVYSPNGFTSFYNENVKKPDDAGAWLCAKAVPGAGNFWIVAGEHNVRASKKSELAGASRQGMRFLHLKRNSTNDFEEDWFFDVAGASKSQMPPIVDLVIADQTVGFGNVISVTVFAVDATGGVYKYQGGFSAVDGNGYPTTFYTKVAQIPDCEASCISIADDDCLHVGGRAVSTGYGMVWHSRAWDSSNFAAFVGERVPFMGAVNGVRYFGSVSGFGTGVASIVGAGGFGYVSGGLDNRCYPTLLALADGSALLACANLNKAIIEVYLSESGGGPFFQVATLRPNDSFSGGAWTAQTSNSIPDECPRPTLAEDPYGTILLMVGQGGYCSVDGGRSWIDARDSSLPMALGNLFATGNYSATQINRTRHALAHSGGRVISTVLDEVGLTTAYFRTWCARAWQAATSPDQDRQYVPIILGKGLHVGVEDVKATFSGLPNPGDSWTSAPSYSYPLSNISGIDSPSCYWRSKGDTPATQLAEMSMVWNAEDVYGFSGARFDITGFALFGTNFKTVTFQTSNDSGFSSGGNYANLTNVIATGTASPPTGSNIYSILRDTTKTWLPDQFASGYAAAGSYGIRNFYLMATSGGYSGYCFLIVRSDRDSVTIYNPSNYDLGSSVTYDIFADRHLNFPSGLTTSTTRFCKYVRVTIPAQRTADGHYKIGQRRIGQHVSYTPHTGNESRHRFVSGFGYSAIQATQIQSGITGAMGTSTFGKAKQRWQMRYENMLWHDRDQLLNPLLPRINQPLCFLFNGDDMQSAELVQIVENPTVENVPFAGDRYNVALTIEELV